MNAKTCFGWSQKNANFLKSTFFFHKSEARFTKMGTVGLNKELLIAFFFVQFVKYFHNFKTLLREYCSVQNEKEFLHTSKTLILLIFFNENNPARDMSFLSGNIFFGHLFILYRVFQYIFGSSSFYLAFSIIRFLIMNPFYVAFPNTSFKTSSFYL